MFKELGFTDYEINSVAALKSAGVDRLLRTDRAVIDAAKRGQS